MVSVYTKVRMISEKRVILLLPFPTIIIALSIIIEHSSILFHLYPLYF